MTANLRASIATALLLIAPCLAAPQAPIVVPNPTGQWVGSWASSQQVPEPANAVPLENLHDVTLRQIVHLSVGGASIRVRVSNAFGTVALRVTAAHVARPVSPSASRIDPASDRALQFDGSNEVIIPPGTDYISDPLDYPVLPMSDLAITLLLDSPSGQETGHPGSRATSYWVSGSLASAVDLPASKSIDHWYFLSGVDVAAAPGAASIVVLGDSITDGHGATTNGNDRWTDDLVRRLQGSSVTRTVAVLNVGTGGNHLLTDGLGPNTLARFDRDVLAQNGVRYLVVFEGVNDLGTLAFGKTMSEAEHEKLLHRIIGAYTQIIVRARAHGITVIGATITPFTGSSYYRPGVANEADRQAVNTWIRSNGHFDSVIDFDKAIADPVHPDHLRSDYDCGDHLHPSPAGYQAMADAISLTLFQR
jgi:lysophospholipase L1-like esterase